MFEWVKWFFDGIGTSIISLFIGAILGGSVGYRIGIHKSKLVQTQKAGSDSEQFQVGKPSFELDSNSSESTDIKADCRQSQKAGDNSKQTQIGG